MSKTIWRAGTMLYPVPPVLVSCGDMEKPNLITIAWTGILSSEPAAAYISVRPERHSYDIIKHSGEFVINLVSRSMTPAADFCGVRSGRDCDKFAETRLTPVPSVKIAAPMILESPLSLECKVFNTVSLGSHDMFMAHIVSVNADKQFIDQRGRLDIEASKLVAYAHGKYFELGKRIGSFGYSVMKKKKKARRTIHR